MKKIIVIAVILMCCGVYAMVKLSISQYQDANPQEKEIPSAKQTDAENTDRAAPEEDSVSPASAVQVEAVTEVLSEFLSAIKSEDYEQAWMLTSEFFKREVSFEEFKKGAPKLVNATVDPESAIDIAGRVGLLMTIPSEEQGMYFLFNQEDGQWKFHSLRPAQSVDTLKE